MAKTTKSVVNESALTGSIVYRNLQVNHVDFFQTFEGSTP